MSPRPADPVRVVDSGNSVGQIDYADTAAAPAGERAVPYHCPFCAEEDLRPLGDRPGAWHCRSCLRAFSVRFLGLAHPPGLELSSRPSGRRVPIGEGDRGEKPLDDIPDPSGGPR